MSLSNVTINMPSDSSSVTPLLLIGGQSSRMGRPKHLLPLPNSKPLYLHLLELLNAAFPESTILVSVHGHIPEDSLQLPATIPTEVVRDSSIIDASGPALGMLTAHFQHPGSTLLVVPCSHPLVTVETFEFLLKEYVSPETCFENENGSLEPLLGLWGPEALKRLAERCKAGHHEADTAVEDLRNQWQGRVLTVQDLGDMADVGRRWLKPARTPQEWEECMGIHQPKYSISAARLQTSI